MHQHMRFVEQHLGDDRVLARDGADEPRALDGVDEIVDGTVVGGASLGGGQFETRFVPEPLEHQGRRLRICVIDPDL